ncbi:hypothetical protein IP78_10460 [Brevundimonas sp. AAP58]|nr:hypothetical protein IP78_10460 [Brevundimonas sp. AAP58]
MATTPTPALPQTSGSFNGSDLVGLADRYCIGPDGDHRATWQYIAEDGFTPLTAEDFPNLHLPGSFERHIRAFRKFEGSRELRVITAANRMRAPGQGITYLRWCWVSSSVDDVRRVDGDMRELVGVRSFRVEGPTRLFAWIPRPDGSNEAISRRVFMREGWTLAREQGLRQLTLTSHEGGVFVGYASPRTEETWEGFDWSGPEPVPRP